MPHAALTPAAPTDRAALLPLPSTAASPCGTPSRAAHTNAASSPPAPPLVAIAPYTGDSHRERELAACVADLRVPANRPSQGAPTSGPTARFKPSRTDPLNREPTAKSATAPFKPSRIDPLNRKPGAFPDPSPQPVHRVHETAHIRESTRCAAHPEPAPQARSLCRR